MDIQTAILRARNDRLDDEGERWTDQEVYRTLGFALNATATEYVQMGGKDFEVTSTLTSSSDGLIDLSLAGVLQMHSVAAIYGSAKQAVDPIKSQDSYTADRVARQYEVRYSEKPVIGIASFNADGTISSGGGFDLISKTNAIDNQDAFEDLVCLRASMDLVLKDGDANMMGLFIQQEARMMSRVFSRLDVPKSFEMAGSGSALLFDLKYFYRAGFIHICRKY